MEKERVSFWESIAGGLTLVGVILLIVCFVTLSVDWYIIRVWIGSGFLIGVAVYALQD